VQDDVVTGPGQEQRPREPDHGPGPHGPGGPGALDQSVAEANTAVSKAESIRKYAVLPGDLTEENGYLTPSLELRRNLVMRDFADDVEGLCSGARAE